MATTTNGAQAAKDMTIAELIAALTRLAEQHGSDTSVRIAVDRKAPVACQCEGLAEREGTVYLVAGAPDGADASKVFWAAVRA